MIISHSIGINTSLVQQYYVTKI